MRRQSRSGSSGNRSGRVGRRPLRGDGWSCAHRSSGAPEPQTEVSMLTTTTGGVALSTSRFRSVAHHRQRLSMHGKHKVHCTWPHALIGGQRSARLGHHHRAHLASLLLLLLLLLVLLVLLMILSGVASEGQSAVEMALRSVRRGETRFQDSHAQCARRVVLIQKAMCSLLFALCSLLFALSLLLLLSSGLAVLLVLEGAVDGGGPVLSFGG
mmetsp:Transcript_8667/g.26907  ORF Transcript_8667/g.26907 Transcript_8667/m.26907 type:complete len:212 (+) Transcript_8667:473-1108(+)